jgi:hypothetical protein
MRPSEIEKKGAPSLWGSLGVKPNGINQGGLGDCWFLAAASAIAEKPSRLQKIFVNTDYPAEGIFELNMFFSGRPTTVVVDDRLPVTSWGSPSFTGKSTNGAWWGPIIEKAYAKLNVNYKNIVGGNPLQAFRVLTNMPGKAHTVRSYGSNTSGIKMTPDQIFDIIDASDKNGFLMTASCDISWNNMVSGHAFTILSAHTLMKDGAVYKKLIKIRNPWSSERYTGPWSDSDTRWTADFKSQVGLVVANDGTFFIDSADFHKAYYTFAVVHYKDWKTTSKKITSVKQSTATKFEFSNPVAQSFALSLDGLQARWFPSTACRKSEWTATYSLQLYDSADTKIGETQYLYSYLGYSNIIVDSLPAGDYYARIYRWSGTPLEKLEMTLYADTSAAVLQDANYKFVKAFQTLPAGAETKLANGGDLKITTYIASGKGYVRIAKTGAAIGKDALVQ